MIKCFEKFFIGSVLTEEGWEGMGEEPNHTTARKSVPL
jgi:hypothetical protein